jgi:hypothetical protein
MYRTLLARAPHPSFFKTIFTDCHQETVFIESKGGGLVFVVSSESLTVE